MARYNINDLFLEIAINENFEEKVKMSVPEIATNENYKLEVTYKFKYRKS